jgi:hypothetical protein
MKTSIPNHFCSKSYTVLVLRYVLIMIYRYHFFHTMERVGGLHLQFGRLLKAKRPGIRLGEILRRSEVTTDLTRPLKKMQASEFFPLLYYIIKHISDAPSPALVFMLVNVSSNAPFYKIIML